MTESPPIVLKHLPFKLISSLTILFNNAINNNYFPTLWKTAKVLPILKKDKNPSDPSSYRPISLTPSLSKVFEAIINEKITSFCSNHNIIPDYQFGFKHHHSTTHAIHRLLSDVNSKVGNNLLVGAALLDLEKAFDSVWLNGLLFKLHKKKFPKWLLFMIWDMISNKSFITSDGINSSTIQFNITEGLQQGTVNSPILFNIFTADLLKAFDFNKPNNPSILAFADDIITYTSGNRVANIQTDLENAVDKINRYYCSWNLRLNPSKCESILFRKPLRYLSSTKKAGYNTFKILATVPGTSNKIALKHKKVVKYLGVHIITSYEETPISTTN